MGIYWSVAMRALRILFAVCPLLLAFSAAIPAAAEQKDKVDIMFDELNQLYGSGKLAEALTLAIKTRDIAEKEYGTDDRRFHRAVRAVELMHMEQRQFDQAEPIYQQLLAKQEQILGPDHEDVAKTLSQFGTLRMLQGRNEEAESYYRRTLAIQDKIASVKPAEHADTLGRLGRFLAGQKRYDEAEPLLKRARAIMEAEAEAQYKRSVEVIEKTKGPDDPEVAKALRTLAQFYVHAEGQQAKAAPVYQRMIAILEKAKGPDDFDLVAVLHGLGYAQTSTRNFTEAETSYLRALAIAEKVRGPEDHDVIDSLVKLAEYYSSTGVIKAGVLGESSPQIRAKVVDYYRRAIGIAEKTGGNRQPDLESLLGKFALFCTFNNLHPEASKIRERMLSMAEASKDKDGPLVSGTDRLVSALTSLGDAYSSERRYAEAEAIYKRVMEMGATGRVRGMRPIDAMRGRLIAIYKESGRYADAEPVMRQVLAESEQEVADGKTPEYRALHSPLMELADLLVDMNKPDEAEPIVRRALAMAEQADKNELSLVDEVIAKDRLVLGNLMFEADRFSEAEKHFRQAMQEAERKDLNQKASAYDSLARLLSATNRPEEAEAFFNVPSPYWRVREI
jgi:tetratricopeptide (TPR) repeat protein